MKNYIGEILASTFTAILGFLAWLNERNKQKTARQKQKNDQEQSIIKMYQDALDDFKKRYDAKFEELEKELEIVRGDVNRWKAKYATLKREFDNYKKAHK